MRSKKNRPDKAVASPASIADELRQQRILQREAEYRKGVELLASGLMIMRKAFTDANTDELLMSGIMTMRKAFTDANTDGG